MSLRGALLVAGILALAFNLRGSITGLPPVFPVLTRATGLTPGSEAALAAVPVVGFAAFSGMAPLAARKLGEERVLGIALALLAAGLGLRSAWPGAMLFPGTILASCAIALTNVLLPSLIKRRRPERAGLLIGLYLTTLTTGAVLGSLIAVPVFNAMNASSGSGGAVRLTYGIWALPALIAACVWLPQLRFRTVPAEGGRPSVLAMARHPLAWQVTLFMGLQSLSYYATLSWFPTMFQEHGISATAAGNLLALMNVGNVMTGLAVPVLAQRARDQRMLAVAAALAIIAGLIGAVFGPNSVVVVFVCVLGLGQGASLSLSVFLFTARTVDGQGAAALSGFAQGVGYVIASTGPLLLGFLHTVTGGWAVPGLTLLGAGFAQLGAGVLAGRALTIGGPGQLAVTHNPQDERMSSR
ncbi:MAG TPA: MFS transporter [Streptosporangiaceae bacterium]|nr:MFS transporter [Streptosporangiaceae bacterium]